MGRKLIRTMSRLSKPKPPLTIIDLMRKVPVHKIGFPAYFVLFAAGNQYGVYRCYEWGKQSADKRYEAKQLMEKSGEVQDKPMIWKSV